MKEFKVNTSKFNKLLVINKIFLKKINIVYDFQLIEMFKFYKK